jgi:hypothetical protein
LARLSDGRHPRPIGGLTTARTRPGRLPLVSHADAHLHGRRSPPRSQHRHFAARHLVKLGTPDACNDCHADKTAQWAANAIQSWHGPERKGFQHCAQAFHDAWADRADAEALVIAAASDSQTPGFARAGALAELAPYLSSSNVGIVKTEPCRSRSHGADWRARHAGTA